MISTGSIIVADTSGQTIQKPYIRQEKNRVYITDDNKYIVVDEIKFEIYRPEHGVTIGPQESWYDVDSWVISQKDFDTVKALTGIGGALLGIGDITLPEQGEIKDKYNYVQQGAYPTTPRATKDYHIKTLAAFGFQFEIDILQAMNIHMLNFVSKFLIRKNTELLFWGEQRVIPLNTRIICIMIYHVPI